MNILNNIYTFSIFPSYITQGISTKAYGNMQGKDSLYPQNLAHFTSEMGISIDRIVTPHQTHTNHVEIVNTIPSETLENTDGLVTSKENIFLGIVTADCVPVLFADPYKGIVGIAHAGYKGLLKGILQATMESFRALGSVYSDILIGIGPNIGVCCYTVSKERIDLFEKEFPTFKNIYEERNGEYFLNLAEVSRQILIESGIGPEHIESANICTKDAKEHFYSFRGDTKEDFGEFISIIGRKA